MPKLNNALLAIFLKPKNMTLFLFATVFSLTFIQACASRWEINQLRLGIWAAEHELWDEAIFRWQKALEKEPNSAILHNNLAVAYEKKGLFEKAREEYELALKLAPEHQYIKANYRYFQDSLKATEKPEKKGEQKKEEKGKDKEKGLPRSGSFILNH